MDLFASKKVKCAECGNKIASKEPTVKALKKEYHANCFVCKNCKKPVGGDYYAVDDHPWCLDCYVEHKAPKCAECGRGIADKKIKIDDGRYFHEVCLKNATQGTCGTCKQQIGLLEPIIYALGKNYHTGCFRCADCQKAITGESEEFKVKNDQPLCDNCASKAEKMENGERRNSGTIETLVETVSEVTLPDEPKTYLDPEISQKETETVYGASDTLSETETQVKLAEVQKHHEVSSRETEPLEGRDAVSETIVREVDEGAQQTNERNQHGYPEELQVWLNVPKHRTTNLRLVDGPECTVCADPITNGVKVHVNGKNFHEECFKEAFVGECSGCNKKIGLTEPSVTVPVLGRDWHPQCLNCGLCGKNIDEAFNIRDETPICGDCYAEKVAPVCAGCDKHITGSIVKAFKCTWHPECFNCEVCHEPLVNGGNEFFNYDGKPYCKRDIEIANIRVA